VVRAAAERRVPVRCVWLSTPVDDAQVNAAWRLAARYGRLPDGEEIAALHKHDVSAFLPTVQFRFQRELEPPDASEGFSRIDVVPFERRRDPAYGTRAVIVWCDDVLLRSARGAGRPAHPDEAAVVEGRGETLRRYQDRGWRLLGMSWQPEIDGGTQSAAGAEAVFRRMNVRLGLSIEVVYCPHRAGPPRCWCRKPLPGLGVLLIQRHLLDPRRCLFVGAGPQDPGFARKLGFAYVDADDFFAGRSPHPA
jgi:histidinol phosphatase-like enzyme